MTQDKSASEQASERNGSNQALDALLICDRQSDDWSRGIHTPIEHYILQRPDLADDESQLLDLVYNEVLLRERHGQPAQLREYERRFPELVSSLKCMFEVHDAIENSHVSDFELSNSDHAEDDTKPTLPQSSAITESSPLPRLPGYQFIERIGRGGMGIVYRARQHGTDRDVAVKVFYAGLDASEEEIARFNIESQASASLKHPSIVTVHEAGVRDGIHFLAMEWIDGMTLAERLEREPLSHRDSARLLEVVARAVHYANECGITHRDIKPQNILLDRDGQAHVADFGLARFEDQNATWTTGGKILGTLHYMAPEQAGGEHDAVGRTTDVYGLGAVLYQCLSGQPPFHQRSAPELFHDLLHRDPPLPSRIRNDVPADLDQICRKCVEKQPRARYATAAEMADDLSRFLRGEPVSARPLSRAGVALRIVKRNPVVSSLVSTTLLMLVVSLAVSVLSARQYRQSGIQLSEMLDRAKAAESRMKDALSDSQILRAEQRHQTKTEGQRHDVLKLVSSTLDLSDGQTQDAEKETRLRNQVANALAITDVQLMKSPVPPPIEADFESRFSQPYSIRLDEAGESIFLTNKDTGTEQLIPLGFRVEQFKIHPFLPVAAVWDDNALSLVKFDRDNSDRVIAVRGTRRIQSFDWDYCGSSFAIGSADHLAYIFNLDSLDQPSLILTGAHAWVTSVAFSEDGLLLAACRGGGRTRVYDAYTGHEIVSFEGVGESFDPTGQFIVGTLEDSPACWKVIRPSVMKSFGPSTGVNAAYGIHSNRRGDRFLICEWDEICLWNAHEGFAIDKVPSSNPKAARFIEADGHATGFFFVDAVGPHAIEFDGTARLSGVQSPVQSDEAFCEDIDRVGFCLADVRDSKTPFMGISKSPHVSLIQVAANRADWISSLELCEVEDAACSPDGNWLALSRVGSSGVELYDLERQQRSTILETKEPCISLSFDPESSRLIAGGSRTYDCFRIENGKRICDFKFDNRAASRPGISWHPDGMLLAVTHRMDRIDLVDTLTGRTKLSLNLPQNGSWLHFTPDGKHLYCRDASFRLVQWNLQELFDEFERYGLAW
ncbi:MAG: protein kinase [Planctomycetota bacterium]